MQSIRDTDEWPSGLERSIALIGALPNDLARRCGIEFKDSYDNLDYIKWSLLQAIGKDYALVYYVGSPSQGIEIWTKLNSIDLKGDLLNVLNHLKLSKDDLKWVCPEITLS